MKILTTAMLGLLIAMAIPSDRGTQAASLPESTWPREMLGTGADGVPFVDNRVCQQCHPQAFQAWLGSHHEQAMQPAPPQTVLGDFSDASFVHQGVTSRFFTKGEKFFVHTQGPDGQLADFEIRYTFGVEPLQQYLIPLPGGRLQSLSIAWDMQKQRWFHLYPDEKIQPGAPLHWTGLYQTWNVMCAECHSTNLRKQYDSESKTYQTTWSAINVSCQACHGPGGRHVTWAQNASRTSPSSYGDRGLLVDFKQISSREQIDQCARCHSRRQPISPEDQHARPLLDDFVPERLRAGLYYADGQILEEVYVYGSFLQSKMYHAGVACTDCHQPHSLSLRASGNALCTQCHQPQPDQNRFPTLSAKAYDTPAHHFHPLDTPGAQCVNCHMPTRTYMVIDDRRDHSLRIPRPDLSARFDTPDVCSGCHVGRTATWAASVLKKWYGDKTSPHYAETLAAGREGRAEAVAKLAQLVGAEDQPSIVRATALDLLGQYGPAGAGAIVPALAAPDPLMRTAAVGSLDGLSPEARLAATAPLLQDPIRAVRIEAARVLASVPAQRFTPEQRQHFETALGEFLALQMAEADTPSAHLNLAVMEAQQGHLTTAVQSYQTALQLDPGFLPARFNLANLYNQMGRNAEAEDVLRKGLQAAPEEGELFYSLGLLLAEEQRLEEAAKTLHRASTLLPKRVRVHYNYGLTLQHLGRREEAETALRNAHQIEPNDADVLQALTIFYVQGQHWEQAATYAEQLVRLHPNAPGPRQLLHEIRLQQR
jgi:tetratricopeptide (TPR) repeat protein